MIAWLLAMAMAGECPEPVATTELEARLLAAEAAFHELDAQGFHREVDQAALELPCVADPVGPTLAARYHGVIGVRQLISRERERARLSLAAARGADPNFDFGEGFLPDGHIGFSLFQEVTPPADQVVIPEPDGVELRFDGTPRPDRSESHPTIVQVLDGSGSVVLTGYLRPGDPLPAYPRRVPEPEPEARGGRRTGWLLASAGSALTSVALFGASAATADRFAQPDPRVPLGQLERQQRVTNGLVVGSGVAGAAAVGTLTVGLIPRR